MLNIGFITLFSFVLVYLNIIILNEEILILICFVAFCWICTNKVGKTIAYDLENRSLTIKNSLKVSLNNLLKTLINVSKLHSDYEIITSKFKILHNYYIQLGTTFVNNLPKYEIAESQKKCLKKFLFVYNLEKQTTKLLVLILSEKLKKLSQIQKLCGEDLQEKRFMCFNKIVLREYMEII
uniref:ATP synthase F0 subunit b n=1 Tax=Caulacanthus okamurae TaxID=152008 RepID=A0A6H1U7F0_9FLOR|nr:ATP synthase F0 subunit b [Caulacanthus okamurae]QIZ74774.1 ATP synthase F0 subunit b [Caulacanthus okamurae]